MANMQCTCADRRHTLGQRALSVAMAASLVFGLLPTTAFADSKNLLGGGLLP